MDGERDGADAVGLVDHVEAEHGREREGLVEALNRAGGNGRRAERVAPGCAWLLGEPRLEQLPQLAAVRDPRLVGPEALVRGELGRPEHLREAGELTVVPGADH